MNRPESRQFLHRTKLPINNFKEVLSQSQAYQSMNSNRSFSGSQNRSPNIYVPRKSTGNTDFNKFPTKTLENRNNPQFNPDHLNPNQILINTNSSNSNHNHNHPTFEKENIFNISDLAQLAKLTNQMNSLTERVCVLESVQQFEEKKILFNAKKFVEQGIAEYKKLDEIKFKEIQKINEERDCAIEKLRKQVQHLGSQATKMVEIKRILDSYKQDNDKQMKKQLQTLKNNLDKTTTKISTQIAEQLSKSNKIKQLENFKKDLDTKLTKITKQMQDYKVKSIQKTNSTNIALFQLSAKILTNKKSPNSQTPQILQQITQIYKIDKEGFLMDSQSKYLLDSRNYMIRVDQNMLAKLSELGVMVSTKSN